MTRPISRQAQYLILSSEVGEFFAGAIPAGGYGTRQTSTTNMQVDYVRAYTPAVPPANTAAPVMTGTPEVDQTLSCSTGSWVGQPGAEPGLRVAARRRADPGRLLPHLRPAGR